MWKAFVGFVGALVMLAAFAGCGGNNQAELSSASTQGAQAARQQAKLKELQREVNQQKQAGNASGATASGGDATSSGGGSGGVSGAKSCGGGLYAGPNTSCPFAQNVRSAYFKSGGGSVTVNAFSPTTGRSYSMSCSGSSPTACTGGNSASVYFF